MIFKLDILAFTVLAIIKNNANNINLNGIKPLKL